MERRKVKCDVSTTGMPCSNCRKARRSDCHLHKRRERKAGRPGESKIAAHATQVNVQPQQQVDANISHYLCDTPSEGPSSQLDPRLWETGEQLDTLAQPSSAETNIGACQCALVEFLQRETSTTKALDRQTAQIEYIGTPSSNLNFLQSRKYSKSASSAHVPAETFDLPEKRTVDLYLYAYLENIHPWFPVVDTDQFISYVDYTPHPETRPSFLLFNALLLVGAHILCSQADREATKSLFYTRARTLFDAGHESSKEITVQAALLMTWYANGAEDEPDDACYWINVARTIAVGMGMHRSTETSSMSHEKKAEWRRLWWLLFQSDIQMSVQLGRPQAIHLDDCDVDILQQTDLDSKTDASSVVEMSKLSVVISGILRTYFRPRASLAQRAAARLEADRVLHSWSVDVPTILNGQSASIEDDLDRTVALDVLHHAHHSASTAPIRDADITAGWSSGCGYLQHCRASNFLNCRDTWRSRHAHSFSAIHCARHTHCSDRIWSGESSTGICTSSRSEREIRKHDCPHEYGRELVARGTITSFARPGFHECGVRAHHWTKQ